ncbi:LysR family transcriptional regulator [Streptomyces camelliae]|uniref:LysR substrate-binding domain-containing protein n=1 Tax=Streptomyces camelliae TaxID=3004093 RepID=A0ABY7PGF3_9ACTN|nr:LysR substrate-binding domain-containing protein [Streptomyces sp. HUAS 2-6]WBO69714.1 LysR substrate-binding domain-containing protein [Streptomyces sp. HUAS 2-6]
MELRQLKYLVTVVEEASFTHAATKLHVAQPGVSAQVRQLERELGETLLDRSGRGVRPTAAGEAILPYARAALAAVEGARASIDELTGLVRGQVRIGALPSMASIDLPEVLAGFHRRHPDVDISLAEGTAEHLALELHAGRLDLALLGAGVLPPGVATQVVADEALVAAVHPSDPLARRERITAGALRDRPLISLPTGTGLRACADEACAAAGFQPHIALEAGDPHMVTRFAARGLGVALVSESLARAHAPEVSTVTIVRAPRARILLAWRADGPAGPAARALIRHARAALPDLPRSRPNSSHPGQES